MRSFLRVITGFVLVGTFVGALGCARNTTSNVAGIQVRDEGSVDKRIIINHKGFNKRVSIETLDVRTVGELLQAKVVIQSHKKKTIPFAYKFEWFDGQGYPVDTGISVWKNDWLKGLDERRLTGVAPNAKAVDVKLHIRQVKN